MDEPSAAITLTDLQAVWVALLTAQDYMTVPSGFEPDDHPSLKVSRARTIIEAAMSAAGDGDGYEQL